MVFEHTFLQDGHLLRPFSRVAEVKCRGYSWPLQRRITDFGSDDAFAKVNDKLAEHYGISIPDSSARNITEEHAHAIRRNECLKDENSRSGRSRLSDRRYGRHDDPDSESCRQDGCRRAIR